MSGFFAAVMATYLFCQSGEPVQDGKCGDVDANKVEMYVLTGRGLCPEWDCAGEVREIVRIERDGKVVLSVPVDAIDRDTLDKLWMAMKPRDRLELMK